MSTAQENLAAILKKAGIPDKRIWTCTCGQKNAVDAVKVIVQASRAYCGKCKQPLRAPQ